MAGFRIDGILGRGGMGVVYEATQLSLNRRIALKVLDRAVGGDDFQERFRREGQVQAALDHPYIVTVFEAGEADVGMYLAMRLIRGPNLKDVIGGGPVDARRALRMLATAGEALDTAHDAGLVHRDIKPQNILIGAGERGYLADFGLTKALGDRGLTDTGRFIGTFDYISPEQIRGEQATRYSDLYAFGAVLYECLTGLVPYPKDTDAAVLFAHMSDPPPRPTAQRPELASGLDAVLERAMAKEAAQRFDTIGELLAAAEEALGPPPPEPPPAPTRPARARPAPPPEPPPEPEPEPEPEPIVETPPEPVTEVVTEPPPAPPPVAPPETPSETPPEAPPEAPAERDLDLTRMSGARPAAVERADPGVTRMSKGPATAAEAAPARGRPIRPLILPVAALAVAGLGVAGFLIGRSGGGTTAGPGTASAGALQVSYPTDWAPRPAPAIPGLTLRDAAAFGPRNGTPVRVLVGSSAPAGPSLLPAAFAQRLNGEPDASARVRLGSVPAFRYDDLRPDGVDDRLRLFAAPTSAGVAIVACRGSAPALASACDGVAASLRLRSGVRPAALPPEPAFASALTETLDRFNAVRGRERAALGSARRPGGQAQAAAGLAAAATAAATALADAPAGPGTVQARGRLVAALRAVASGYRRLSAAAKRHAKAAFATAATDVVRAEDAVAAALDALDQIGYRAN